MVFDTTQVCLHWKGCLWHWCFNALPPKFPQGAFLIIFGLVVTWTSELWSRPTHNQYTKSTTCLHKRYSGVQLARQNGWYCFPNYQHLLTIFYTVTLRNQWGDNKQLQNKTTYCSFIGTNTFSKLSENWWVIVCGFFSRCEL